MGEAPGRVHLVSTPEDVDTLQLDNDRLAVTTQTTLSIWDTQDVIDAVAAKYPQVEVHNDICLATQDRQEAAVQAADVCDLVIVVGSQRSSNSHRLVEVVRNVKQTPAYLVDSADDVEVSWFKPGMRVGVTAGASTPARVTRRVIEVIEAYEPVAVA